MMPNPADYIHELNEETVRKIHELREAQRIQDAADFRRGLIIVTVTASVLVGGVAAIATKIVRNRKSD